MYIYSIFYKEELLFSIFADNDIEAQTKWESHKDCPNFFSVYTNNPNSKFLNNEQKN